MGEFGEEELDGCGADAPFSMAGEAMMPKDVAGFQPAVQRALCEGTSVTADVVAGLPDGQIVGVLKCEH